MNEACYHGHFTLDRPMTILVIAAHPDDEVLGCGGTIAKLSDSNHNVVVAILGEGLTSRSHDNRSTDRSQLKRLKQQCRSATTLLGVNKTLFYDLPDNRFDSLPLLDVIKIVEDIMEKTGPEIIFTHHPGDLNIDHKITHRAVLTAARPFEGSSLKEVLAFEIPSSTEWGFSQFSDFSPNVFVDISTTIQRKSDALSMYDSEIKRFPHPRSTAHIENLAKVRGAAAGMRSAEAFSLILKRM